MVPRQGGMRELQDPGLMWRGGVGDCEEERIGIRVLDQGFWGKVFVSGFCVRVFGIRV